MLALLLAVGCNPEENSSIEGQWYCYEQEGLHTRLYLELNNGKADLIIRSCSATCGCTVASYPKDRIAPGGEGYVTVSFNSSGKSGQQYQEVTVVSNAQPARCKLKITAQVGY